MSPLRIFGSNHVDLGGITSPASLTAITCTMLVGYKYSAIDHSPLFTLRSSSAAP